MYLRSSTKDEKKTYFELFIIMKNINHHISQEGS